MARNGSLVARVATPRPSWNVAADVHELFRYAFMRHAFLAGTIVAVLAGVVGYLVVLRQSSFAAHALSEIGFAGATGGVVYGVGAVTGLLVFALGGAALIGLLGKRLRGRDAAIGTVLAFALGLGSYFLTKFKGNASGGFGLLFGAVYSVSVHDIVVIAVAATLSLALIAAVYRPLLFSSLDEDVAEARGVPVRAMSVVFFVVLAVAVTAAVQVVGVLLISTLLVTPGAIADRLCATAARAIVVCVGLSLAFVWAGLAVYYYSSFPPGFLIATFAFLAYLVTRLAPAARSALGHRTPPSDQRRTAADPVPAVGGGAPGSRSSTLGAR